jgi:hypothetical protein
VAARLHISVNTVRTHLQNIMAKLGVHSTLEAIAMVRSRSQPHPGLPEHVQLTVDRTASLHQSIMQTAHALRSTASETAALLEQQADLLEQPWNIDYQNHDKAVAGLCRSGRDDDGTMGDAAAT